MEPTTVTASDGAAGKPQEAAHVTERKRRALWTTLSSFVGRGIGMLVSLISVPLTIHFLDKELYGVWLTVGSFLAWLSIADLGLANGLTNSLVASRAKGDDSGVRAVISTAFVIVACVSLLMAIGFALVIPVVPWARALGASRSVSDSDLLITVAICGGIFVAGFPLNLLDRIYGAFQEGYIANYWSVASNVVSATALVLVVRYSHGLPALVLALSGTPLLVRALSAIDLLNRRYPQFRPTFRAYDPLLRRQLLAAGSSFLIVQLVALANWQNDNIIIAQLFGAAAVGPYAISFRLASFYMGFVAMYVGPLWPAYADAAARGEYEWIRSSKHRTTLIVLGVTLVATAGIVVVGADIIRIWTRSSEMVPDRKLLVPISVWMITIAWCLPHGSALNGIGRLRGQMTYGGFAAVANVVLSIVLGRRMGVAGVCWATCVAGTICAVCTPIELRYALRELIAARDAAAEKRSSGPLEA